MSINRGGWGCDEPIKKKELNDYNPDCIESFNWEGGSSGVLSESRDFPLFYKLLRLGMPNPNSHYWGASRLQDPLIFFK